MPIMGGKVHEVTNWGDDGPEHVFPLCRTGSMTNQGTRYRKTTLELTCVNCIDNRARRRARLAQEAAAQQTAPVEATPAAEPVDEAPTADEQRETEADRIRSEVAAEARETAAKLEAQALATNEVITDRARGLLALGGHAEHADDRAGFRFRVNHLGVRLYAVDATGTELTGADLDAAFDAYTETLEAQGWYVRLGDGFHGSSLSLLPPAGQAEEVVAEGKRRREAAEADAQPTIPDHWKDDVAREIGARAAALLAHTNAANFKPAVNLAGKTIGWTFSVGHGSNCGFGFVTLGGRVSHPTELREYRWQADEFAQECAADSVELPPLAAQMAGDTAALDHWLKAVRSVDEVTLNPDGPAKLVVRRGPDFLGVIFDDGEAMNRGRYSAWAPYGGGRDGIVGYFSELDDAKDAVAHAFPVTVGEIAGEAGVRAADILDAAQALAAEWEPKGRRAVLKIAAATGADTKLTAEAAAAILQVLPAAVSTVADVAAVRRVDATGAAEELAEEWATRGHRAVYRSVVDLDADLSPAAAVVLVERLTPRGIGSVPFHGPEGYTGRRALCGYADHAAPLGEDGKLQVHERTAGQIGACPGSLLTGRAHRGQATRQYTTALSYDVPRKTWLVSGSKPGDVVVVEGEELTVENCQAGDEAPSGRIWLILSGVGLPLTYSVGDELPFKRRVRRQDARCQDCGVYVVVESDTATDGPVKGRLCGVCDGPVPVEFEQAAR
jgi:hypothetical protein